MTFFDRITIEKDTVDLLRTINQLRSTFANENGMNGKILIVHDTLDLLQHIRGYFAQMEYHYNLLSKPHLLFSALTKEDYDLVFLGLNMNKISGFWRV